MFRFNEDQIQMSAGDYGEALPFRLRECCQDCGREMRDDDLLRLTISRGGTTLVTREKTWKGLEGQGGTLYLVLTKEETSLLPPGLYLWAVELEQTGARALLDQGTFFVGVSV